MNQVEPDRLTDGDLARVHDPDYISHLRSVMKDGPGLLDHGDTYFTPKSFRAARQAAGAAVAVTKASIKQPNCLGLSIARPPGHHASSGRALGFCLLNNVALAARAAQAEGLGRIMIVDFDVHHGNGTQDIFYDDPTVMLVSIHQWGLFPGTGRLEEHGTDDGEGTTVNVPLPAGVGHRGYLRLAREFLPRVAEMFQPQIMLLSAGFDGHWKDPLAGLRLSSRTFYQLGRLFGDLAQEHCEGRISCIQEGGYLAAVLADSLHALFRGLLQLDPAADPTPAPDRPEPNLSGLLERLLQQLG